MAAKLGIEYDSFYDSSLAAVGTTGKHVYILYTDDNGTEYVLEGGLYGGDQVHITVRDGLLARAESGDTDGTYIFKSSSNKSTYVALDVANPTEVWNQMKVNAEAIESGQEVYVYGSGPNSNSVAATLLKYASSNAQSLLGTNLPDDISSSNAASYALSGTVKISSLGLIGLQHIIENDNLKTMEVASAESHLSGLGVSMDDAYQFILNSLSTPDTIIQVAEQHNITNDMLAGIHAYGSQSQTTGRDVINYFSSVGVDSQILDFSNSLGGAIIGVSPTNTFELY